MADVDGRHEVADVGRVERAAEQADARADAASPPAVGPAGEPGDGTARVYGSGPDQPRSATIGETAT